MSTEKFNTFQTALKIVADKTRDWSRENKKKSFNIYISIATLSAAITFLVAISDNIPFLKQYSEEIKFLIKVVILILSGTSTVLAAWEGFYNHKQLWLNYGETRNALRALEFSVSLLNNDEKKDDEFVNKLIEEYQDILNHGNKNWTKLRAEDENKKELNRM